MTPERKAGRDAFITYAVVLVLVTGLVRINVTLPAIGHLGSALVSVLFLYAPMVALARRKEDLYDYGFRADPVGKSLAYAGITLLIIFPLFVAGFFAFYEIACNSSLLGTLAPKGTCGWYQGLDTLHAPRITWTYSEYVLVQMLVVALPEELFFRGFMLGLLEKRFPPKRRFLGGGIGLALILSSLAFALVHLPKDGDPRMLATFFPALLFGWMRSATGSILGPTLAHGASNILVNLLNLSMIR